MSKELSPLEVSNQLKDFVLEFVKNGLDRRFIRGSFDIIETALKNQQEIKEVITLLSHITIEQKKILAFEIIKEKRVLVDVVLDTNNVKEYNTFKKKKEQLTQEEYDLLREVLL